MHAIYKHVTPMISTLADRAMLVRLKRSMWTGYAFDQSATIQVEQANGVGAVGRFNKKLMAKSSKFKAVIAAYNALYDYHQSVSLPWLDDGLRLLPSAMYFEYTQEMRALKDAAQRAVDALDSSWANEIAADQARLGPLFRASDYPASVADKFAVSLQFLPVPSSDDFRVAIDPNDAASLDNAILEAEAGVSKYIIEQLLEPLRAASTKLAVPIGEKGAIFRDSLIENLVEVTERLPRLNITSDHEIGRAINEVRDLAAGYARNIDSLREDAATRDVAHAKVKELVANLAGMF